MKILLKEKSYQIWLKNLARKAGEYYISEPDEQFFLVFESYENATNYIGHNKEYFLKLAIERT